LARLPADRPAHLLESLENETALPKRVLRPDHRARR
jgi:hypothetical protein